MHNRLPDLGSPDQFPDGPPSKPQPFRRDDQARHQSPDGFAYPPGGYPSPPPPPFSPPLPPLLPSPLPPSFSLLPPSSPSFLLSLLLFPSSSPLFPLLTLLPPSLLSPPSTSPPCLCCATSLTLPSPRFLSAFRPLSERVSTTKSKVIDSKLGHRLDWICWQGHDTSENGLARGLDP